MCTMCHSIKCPLPLDFPLILCHTKSMTQTPLNMQYTRQQLIDALQHEYEYLCHDDFDPDVDMSSDEHLAYLNSLSVEQLIDETDTDDGYTLDEYMSNHSWLLLWGNHRLSVALTNATLCSLYLIHICSSNVLLTLSSASALIWLMVLLMLCSTMAVCITTPMFLVVLLLTCNCNPTCLLVSGLTTIWSRHNVCLVCSVMLQFPLFDYLFIVTHSSTRFSNYVLHSFHS